MEIHPIDLIIIFLSGSGLLICLIVGIGLMIRKKGVKLTNRLLGLLLILFALTTLNSMMAGTGILYQNKQLYFLPLTYSLSIGPLFYFFIQSKIQPSFRLKKADIIHFVIPAIQFLFYSSVGFRSVEYKGMIWERVVYPYVQYIEEGLLISLGLYYLIKVLLLLQNKIPEQFWKKPVYIWLKRFTKAFLLILIIHSFYEISSWIATEIFDYNIFNNIWLVLPLKIADASLSLLIGINAFIYQHQSLIIPTSKSQNIGTQEKINAVLIFQKAYLDPELNLETFSKQTGLHKNDISKFFGDQGDTFRGKINAMRVSEFIEKADSGKYNHLSLLGLAFESGFNSKASFNRIFKEMKGETPSSFINEK
ncbi:MAG: helix-turn-helix domain-containing protein [Ekhidna sp.]